MGVPTEQQWGCACGGDVHEPFRGGYQQKAAPDLPMDGVIR
jgi:hypothetical protein